MNLDQLMERSTIESEQRFKYIIQTEIHDVRDNKSEQRDRMQQEGCTLNCMSKNVPEGMTCDFSPEASDTKAKEYSE